jgi:hypothetical protein
MQRSLDPAKLVFIDETSAATNMARPTAGPGGASAFSRQYPMVIARPPPSSLDCARMV